MKLPSPVPVLMFHSVTNSHIPEYKHLSTPLGRFEEVLRYLTYHGFKTLTLYELYDFLANGQSVPEKSVVLTFDDGYLDNWVNAFPFLKKYNMKATIFIPPEFINPEDVMRPTLGDVWGRRASESELCSRGYLSWNELQAMHQSGLIDIQSHTMTHTMLFQGSDIVDFYGPDSYYPWMQWNKYPERKYRWLDEGATQAVEIGTPIYQYGRALAGRQFFPNRELVADVIAYVNASRNRLSDPQWREKMHQSLRDIRKHHKEEGRYETDQEYVQRLKLEIEGSKRILSERLRKSIDFLCWPGGAFTPIAEALAYESGYLATTKGERKNGRGADPRKIHRISGNFHLSWLHPTLDKYCRTLYLALALRAYREEVMATALTKAVSKCRRLLRAR